MNRIVIFFRNGNNSNSENFGWQRYDFFAVLLKFLYLLPLKFYLFFFLTPLLWQLRVLQPTDSHCEWNCNGI